MNKQFLSVLLLTCFATSASANFSPSQVHAIFSGLRHAGQVVAQYWKPGVYVAGGLGVGGVAAHNIVEQKAANIAAEAANIAAEAAKTEAANIAAEAANAGTLAEMAQSEVTRVANGLGFPTAESMSDYLANAPMNRAMMAEIDAVNAKLWAQTSVLDKAKYYVRGAYNATGSAATATAQWAQEHPGYAVAAVAGITAAGYLGYKAYNHFTTPQESISAQDQVVIKTALQKSLSELTRQTPGTGFYKDGDFNKLAHCEFFTGEAKSYGLTSNQVWYLNDVVTCAHALNYIKHNKVAVTDAVKAKIQARLEKAESYVSAAIAA